MDLSKLERLHEGKAKTVYAVPGTSQLVQRFKDSATAFNGQKFAELPGKGELNNRISSTAFRYLKSRGIESHYVDTLNTRDMLIEAVRIIPLEVVTRNVIAGSLAKRLGKDEGTRLARPIVELYYKSDALGDPMLNDDHILATEIATPGELDEIRKQALTVASALGEFWGACGLDLVDFKLEFGRRDGKVLLADEISPDTSRLWDRDGARKMDKDVFRRDLADLVTTYREVWARVQKAHAQWVPGALPEAPASR